MARRPLELQSLKWPFVGLAVLLALSTAWAVYDEVVSRRPWKNYQRDFFKLEESHLKADRERARKRLEAPEIKQQLENAQAELNAAGDAISGNPEQRKEYEAALKAEEDARQKEEEAKLYLGFDKSDQDAVYYKLREARHENHAAEEAKLQKSFDHWQRKIEEKTRIYTAAIAAHKAATERRLAFVQRREAAQAKIAAIEKPIQDLDKRLQAFSGLGKLPQMEQYWIANLRNSWGSETVDRCQNCHVAINKGGFSEPWEVLQAKKANLPEADMKAQFALDPEVIESYQKIHDALCEDVPRPPDAVPIGGFKPPAEPSPMDPAQASECRPRADWEKWTELGAVFCGPHARSLARTKTVLKDGAGAVLAEQKAEWKGVSRNPALDALKGEEKPLQERVAQACTDKETLAALDEAVKADPFDVRPVFRTHPHRLELLVKNHVPENFGCTTCHGGQGAQTKGVLHRAFRHGEDDHHWNDPLTDEVTVMGKKYKGAFMQSKCDKCHSQQLTLAHAPLLSKGKKLFTDVGCWGCHPIEGYNELAKRGPTLTNIASKTTQGWLQTWIAYPKGWRPATRMPNFWPGAVDASSVPHPEALKPEEVIAQHRQLRDQEVSAIVAYLWSNSDRAPLRCGGGERHRVPDDAEERSDLSGPEVRQRRAAEAGGGGQGADRQVRLLRLPQHQGIRERPEDRHRADRARAQRRGAARLRRRAVLHRGSQAPPDLCRLGLGEAARSAHLRLRAGRDPDAAVRLHRRGGALHPHLPQGPDRRGAAARIPHRDGPLARGGVQRRAAGLLERLPQLPRGGKPRREDPRPLRRRERHLRPAGAHRRRSEGAAGLAVRVLEIAVHLASLALGAHADLPLQRRGRDRAGALLRRLLEQELPLPDGGGAAAHRGARQGGRPALQGPAVHQLPRGGGASPRPGSGQRGAESP